MHSMKDGDVASSTLRPSGPLRFGHPAVVSSDLHPYVTLSSTTRDLCAFVQALYAPATIEPQTVSTCTTSLIPHLTSTKRSVTKTPSPDFVTTTTTTPANTPHTTSDRSERHVSWAPLPAAPSPAGPSRAAPARPTPTAIENLDPRVRARANQVARMTAERPPPARPSPWPTPSATTLRCWNDRHSAWRLYSEAYTSTQSRMLWLADLAEADRWPAFEQQCYDRALAPTTAAAYWTSWLTVAKAINLKPCQADIKALKILKDRAVAFPVAFPLPLDAQTLSRILQAFDTQLPTLCCLVRLAWVAGQRISDMLQLGVNDVDVSPTSVTVTVRRGKVIGPIQPYCFHLCPSSQTATSLVAAMDLAKMEGRLFIATASNSSTDRQACSDLISTMLLSVNEALELRSIRRGGLQAMAGAGFELEEMRLLSQHRSTEMLLRYLNYGSVCTALATTTQRLTDTLDQCL